jgi:putative heme transporter
VRDIDEVVGATARLGDRVLTVVRHNWHHLRLAITVVVLGAAAYFLVGRAGELKAAGHILARLSWNWIGLAVLAEAASMVVFAGMQRLLLRAGGVRLRFGTLVEITLAGNALATTLPGGVAWAASWAFGQFKRRGVQPFLRVWVFLVAGAVSSFALFIVVFAGIELAGSHGPVSSLRWFALALASIPVVAVVIVYLRKFRALRDASNRAAELVRGAPGGAWLVRTVRTLFERLDAIHMGGTRWAEVFGFALLNWLYDCLVIVITMLALHIAVPWRGIFVIYGLTQIAASFPITPGGLGVVEGGLVALLHAFGVSIEQAVAATLVYRLVSFWGLVPVGWSVWVVLDLLERHGLRPGRPHPWAFHHHALGGTTDEADPTKIRLLPTPKTCTGCDQCATPVGVTLHRDGQPRTSDEPQRGADGSASTTIPG